jgi:hypothetical protein
VQSHNEIIKLAADSFVVHFQRYIEPQKTACDELSRVEQGIMNVEVLKNKNASYLYIPCSIFDIQKNS